MRHCVVVGERDGQAFDRNQRRQPVNERTSIATGELRIQCNASRRGTGSRNRSWTPRNGSRADA